MELPFFFQANLPEYMPDVSIEERKKNCHYGEEMTWEPARIHDHDLVRNHSQQSLNILYCNDQICE